jgi:two-component system response regulator YesN
MFYSCANANCIVYGILLYNYFAKNSMQDQIVKVSTETLDQVSYTIDMLVDNIIKDSVLFLFDIDVNRHLNGLYEDEMNVKMHIIDRINSVCRLNQDIWSIYYYSADDELVITKDGPFHIDTFYDKAWVERMDGDSEQLYWLGTRRIHNPLAKKDEEIFSFFKIMSAVNGNRGALVVNIDANKILDLINNIDAGRQGVFLVFNQEGHIISQSKHASIYKKEHIDKIIENTQSGVSRGFFDYKMDKEHVLVMYTTCPTTGWKIVKIASFHSLFAQISDIQELMIKLAIIVLLIGTVIYLMISKKVAFPLVKLVQSVNDTMDRGSRLKTGNELAYLDKVFKDIMVKNRRLEENYKESLPILRERYIYRLLTVQQPNNEEGEIYYKAKQLGLDLTGVFYKVVVIELESSDFHGSTLSKDILKLELKDKVTDIFNGYKKAFGELDENQVAVILIADKVQDEFDQDIIRQWENLIAGIYNDFGISLTIGLGKFYDSAKNVSSSCEEALEALNYKVILGSRKVICYEDVNRSTKTIIKYPIQDENALIKHLKVNDYESAEELIYKIFGYYENYRYNSYEQIMNHVLQIFVVSVRVFMEKDIELEKVFGQNYNVYHEFFSRRGTLEEIRDWLLSFYKSVIEFDVQSRTRKYEELVTEVVKYAQENFDKPLSLEAAAKSVYMSPQYFNKFFKEHTGSPFGEYLADLRIEKATQLLKSTDLKIKEIAKKTGFNSPDYFTRVFKKAKGMPPNEYRKRFASPVSDS